MLSGLPAIARQLVRYTFVGGIAAVTEWILFSLLVYLGHWHYLVAGTASFLIATLVNYLLGLRWVFKGGRHARHWEVMLVYLVSAIALLINLGTLFVLYELVELHLMLAKLLATGTAFLWNFWARHYWIFHRPLQ